MNFDELEICDGKYKLIFNNDTGYFKCLRYGNEWRELVGDKLVYCLFSELLELKNEKFKK